MTGSATATSYDHMRASRSNERSAVVVRSGLSLSSTASLSAVIGGVAGAFVVGASMAGMTAMPTANVESGLGTAPIALFRSFRNETQDETASQPSLEDLTQIGFVAHSYSTAFAGDNFGRSFEVVAQDSLTHPSSALEKSTVTLADDSSASVGAAPAIVQRLVALATDSLDDGVELARASYLDLLRFVSLNRVQIKPTLSALDSGAVRSVWKNGEREQVAVHFLGERQGNYVLFFLENGKMKREYGRASTSEIAGLIERKGLWRLLRA